MKKSSGRFMSIGVVLVILAIACFIMLSICVGAMEDQLSLSLTARDAKETIKQSEQLTRMYGYDLTEYLGISDFQIFLIKFTSALRIPLLVVGILLLSAGVAVRKFNFGSDSVVRAKEGISRGMAGASTVVKGTFEKVTVKCPKCGKVCHSKTAFCPACGEKMPEPKPVTRSKPAPKDNIKCPNCGKVYHEKVAFCSECGSKIPVIEPVAVVCSGCGTEYLNGEKFCSNCGASLVASAPIKAPESVDTSYEYFEPRKDAYVAPVKPSAPAEYEPPVKPESKPSVTVVTEKKNPFMNKPKGL